MKTISQTLCSAAGIILLSSSLPVSNAFADGEKLYRLEAGASYGWVSSKDFSIEMTDINYPFPANFQDLELGSGIIFCLVPCSYYARTDGFRSDIDPLGTSGSFDQSQNLFLGARIQWDAKTEFGLRGTWTRLEGSGGVGAIDVSGISNISVSTLLNVGDPVIYSQQLQAYTQNAQGRGAITLDDMDAWGVEFNVSRDIFDAAEMPGKAQPFIQASLGGVRYSGTSGIFSGDLPDFSNNLNVSVNNSNFPNESFPVNANPAPLVPGSFTFEGGEASVKPRMSLGAGFKLPIGEATDVVLEYNYRYSKLGASEITENLIGARLSQKF